MKATELMLGDWVLHNGKPKQINVIWGPRQVSVNDPDKTWSSIYIDKYLTDDITPIPLTIEIFRKNGFVKDKTQYDEGIYEFWNENLDRRIYLYAYDEYFLVFDNLNMKINYLHQLQHALRLCGIKKEIII